jgi:hypothetical protein
MYIVGIDPGRIYTQTQLTKGICPSVGTMGQTSDGKIFRMVEVTTSQNLVKGMIVSLDANHKATVAVAGGPAPGVAQELAVVIATVTASASQLVWAQLYGRCNRSGLAVLQSERTAHGRCHGRLGGRCCVHSVCRDRGHPPDGNRHDRRRPDGGDPQLSPLSPGHWRLSQRERDSSRSHPLSGLSNGAARAWHAIDLYWLRPERSGGVQCSTLLGQALAQWANPCVRACAVRSPAPGPLYASDRISFGCRASHHVGRDLRRSDEHAARQFAVSGAASGPSGWALFMDGDMLVRGQINEQIAKLENRFAVYCVKHRHEPPAGTKMDGQEQTRYARKNWSSFMIFNCDHPANKALDGRNWSTAIPGRDLHRFCWLEDRDDRRTSRRNGISLSGIPTLQSSRKWFISRMAFRTWPGMRTWPMPTNGGPILKNRHSDAPDL